MPLLYEVQIYFDRYFHNICYTHVEATLMGYKVVALGEKYLRTISERRPVGYVKIPVGYYVKNE